LRNQAAPVLGFAGNGQDLFRDAEEAGAREPLADAVPELDGGLDDLVGANVAIGQGRFQDKKLRDG
jgi:hypothetical protein